MYSAETRALPSGEKASALTFSEETTPARPPQIERRRVPLVTSQKRIQPVSPAARVLPPGEKATQLASILPPRSRGRSLPVAGSQRRTLHLPPGSLPAEANFLPSGEKATPPTQWVCFLR